MRELIHKPTPSGEDLLLELCQTHCADNPKILDYIQKRVLDQSCFFDRSCEKQKRKYKNLTIISLLCSAAIPVATFLTEYWDMVRLVVILLGSAVTAITSWLATDHTKDNWLRMRQKRELLLSVCYQYVTQTDAFADPKEVLLKQTHVVHLDAQGIPQKTIVTEQLIEGTKPDQSARDAKLVELCETILREENETWFRQKNEK